MSEKTTKTCIRCGAALPEEAAFCPCCTASQIHRRTISVTPPTTRRNQWWIGVLAALVALALPIGAALWSSAAQAETPPPEDTLPLTISRESEDGAEPRYGELCQTYYEGEDGQLYHVFAAFSPGIDGGSTMRGYCSGLLEPGCTDTGPLTLFVEEVASGRNGRDSFSALLEDWSVTVAAPDGGERCTLRDPTFDYISTTDAMLYQELTGTSACADNEIVWTLRMKNGDVVTVKQGVTFGAKTVVEYHWEDTPMNTAAELQALLDDITAAAKAEEAVYLYLPAVTYDAPVSVDSPMTLVGHQEGTTFSTTLTANATEQDDWTEPMVKLRSLTFSGAGGTGVNACGPVYLRGCRFTGWDVAAQALDGGWICSQENTYDSNGVALELDSGSAMLCGSNMNNSRFLRSGVAIRVKRLPVEWMTLELYDCSFYGNTVDLDDPQGLVVRR